VRDTVAAQVPGQLLPKWNEGKMALTHCRSFDR
jgi:hypothetical protein